MRATIVGTVAVLAMSAGARADGPADLVITAARVITLDDAPNGYRDFDKGAAKKFVLDPHGTVKA